MARDFGEFMSEALPELMRYGYSLTGNQHDASDLVQNVLERVGARWESLDGRGIEMYAYVKRAMANDHISWWRRRRREHLTAEVPELAIDPRYDSLENEPLWQALRELPPRQRTVIVLRYYEGQAPAGARAARAAAPQPTAAQPAPVPGRPPAAAAAAPLPGRGAATAATADEPVRHPAPWRGAPAGRPLRSSAGRRHPDDRHGAHVVEFVRSVCSDECTVRARRSAVVVDHVVVRTAHGVSP